MPGVSEDWNTSLLQNWSDGYWQLLISTDLVKDEYKKNFIGSYSLVARGYNREEYNNINMQDYCEAQH